MNVNKIYSFVEIIDNMEAVELAIDGLDFNHNSEFEKACRKSDNGIK
jgi:hypothetical protein